MVGRCFNSQWQCAQNDCSWQNPQGLAIDEENNLIYVVCTHENKVHVIDGKNEKVIHTFAAGKNPYAVIVDPKTHQACAANLSDPPFTILNRAGN